MIKSILTTALIILLSLNIFSQSGFSIHSGASFPLSDFAKDEIDENFESLGACTGFNIGLKYAYPIKKAELICLAELISISMD